MDDKTMKEIGSEIGVSANRVSQILHKAIKKLKHPRNAPFLRRHFDPDCISNSALEPVEYRDDLMPEDFITANFLVKNHGRAPQTWERLAEKHSKDNPDWIKNRKGTDYYSPELIEIMLEESVE